MSETIGIIRHECAWFATIFACVTFAMFLDLLAGVHKARLRHEATTSKGLKRTAAKAEKYYLPLLCATCFDVIVSPLSSYPVFTAVIGLFLVICEFKSIFESTRTKAELRDAESTMQVIIKGRDDVSKIVSEVLKQLNVKNDGKREEKAKTD